LTPIPKAKEYNRCDETRLSTGPGLIRIFCWPAIENSEEPGIMNRILSVSLLLVVFGCTMPSSIGHDMKQTKRPSAETMQLPAPAKKGKMSLEETLARRRSVREFTREPLTEQELSELLWATQGITGPAGQRTAPSAGALYPLEIYVATASGFYHYEPHGHQLSRRSDRDPRPAIFRASLEQEAIREAAAVFVIAAVYERTAQKYGEARTPRYVHLEAGHAAQNLLLEAVSLGLGAVPIGAYYDAQIQKALSLPPDHEPLYLIPVGHPR
jgi:SagB-type dehydrogenase family enzyme